MSTTTNPKITQPSSTGFTDRSSDFYDPRNRIFTSQSYPSAESVTDTSQSDDFTDVHINPRSLLNGQFDRRAYQRYISEYPKSSTTQSTARTSTLGRSSSSPPRRRVLPGGVTDHREYEIPDPESGTSSFRDTSPTSSYNPPATSRRTARFSEEPSRTLLPSKQYHSPAKGALKHRPQTGNTDQSGQSSVATSRPSQTSQTSENPSSARTWADTAKTVGKYTAYTAGAAAAAYGIYYAGTETDFGRDLVCKASTAGVSAYDGIGSFASSACDTAGSMASSVKDTAGNYWTESVMPAASSVGGTLSNFGSSISNNFSGIRSYFGGVSEAYPTATAIGKDIAVKGTTGFVVNTAMSYLKPAPAKPVAKEEVTGA